MILAPVRKVKCVCGGGAGANARTVFSSVRMPYFVLTKSLTLFGGHQQSNSTIYETAFKCLLVAICLTSYRGAPVKQVRQFLTVNNAHVICEAAPFLVEG